MGWLERQARLEERVHDCIDEIADEFDLEVPYYPEVFWIGKGSPIYSKRQDGLQEAIEKDAYRDLRKDISSSYMPETRSIILTTFHPAHRGEESSHFLHMENSGIFSEEYLPFKKLVIEMIGFFGSRVICTNRIGYHPKRHDFMSFPKEIVDELKDTSPLTFAYLQGYYLGAQLWNAYIDGTLSKQKVKELYTKSVRTEKQAEELFLELRNEFWPIPSSEGWIFEEIKSKKKPIKEFRVIW